MGDIRSSQTFDNDDLCNINLHHLHLQVTALLDVTKADGKATSAEVFSGKRPADRTLQTSGHNSQR